MQKRKNIGYMTIYMMCHTPKNTYNVNAEQLQDIMV